MRTNEASQLIYFAQHFLLPNKHLDHRAVIILPDRPRLGPELERRARVLQHEIVCWADNLLRLCRKMNRRQVSPQNRILRLQKSC